MAEAAAASTLIATPGRVRRNHASRALGPVRPALGGNGVEVSVTGVRSGVGPAFDEASRLKRAVDDNPPFQARGLPDRRSSHQYFYRSKVNTSLGDWQVIPFSRLYLIQYSRFLGHPQNYAGP